MKITSITENSIRFDDGSRIHIEPPDVTMYLSPEAQTEALRCDFRYLAFTARPDGFAFGEILRDRIPVRLINTGGRPYAKLMCGGETKTVLKMG